jgi:exodeoxyribonuclease VII large subunit
MRACLLGPLDRYHAISPMNIKSPAKNDAFLLEILTVAQLNHVVGQLLEREIPALWVRGEISNFTAAASGHWYFTLKDSSASVRTVMFRGRAASVGFTPRAADQVEIRARVSLYEPRGDYQLQADTMRRAGVGNLYEAFLRLKEQLSGEGWFDADRKREPVFLPRAIGVITSLHAAALRDVLSVLARRAPHVSVVIYPAPVQGADAAAKLTEQIVIANRRAEVDTLLLVRGGGSIEDLWSFNDKALARAVGTSLIPIISGVGHETDFTIVDFVADMRAPTPTAAAELACTTRQELLADVGRAGQALLRAQQRVLDRAAQRLDRAAARLVSPAQRLAHQYERLNTLRHRLAALWYGPQSRRASRIQLLAQRLAHSLPDTQRAVQRVGALSEQLQRTQRRVLTLRRTQTASAVSRLRALDPIHTVARGYAIASDVDGRIVQNAALLAAGQLLDIQFAQGQARVELVGVTPDKRRSEKIRILVRPAMRGAA